MHPHTLHGYALVHAEQATEERKVDFEIRGKYSGLFALHDLQILSC